MPDCIADAIRDRNLKALRTAIHDDPKAARHPKAMLQAAGARWQPSLALLHEHGGDVNALWRNYRPLHALIQEDAHGPAKTPSSEGLTCFDWLLHHGADPERAAAWPQARALIIAAFSGQPIFVERLLHAGARTDIFTASALGDRTYVKKTLASNPSFAQVRDHDRLTALQCACGSRLPGLPLLDIARLLIDAGADVNVLTRSYAHHVSAAYFAANARQCDLFHLLLERGANPTDALSHAVWGKHFDLAEAALAHGAQVDLATANNKPLLNDLIRWGQIPQALWMLQHGASPLVSDERGWTALHQAVSRGNTRLINAVLDAGGDPHLPDHQGYAAIQLDRLRRLPDRIK